MNEPQPQPQPEHGEPRLAEPTLSDLSKRDYMAIFKRALKSSLEDHITNLAAALAYYAFLAIPAVLLVAVGVFSLVAGENAVGEIIGRLQGVAPQEALTLLEDTLQRVTETQANSGYALVIVGSVLALWTDVTRDIALCQRGLAGSVRDLGRLDETQTVASALDPGSVTSFLDRLGRATVLLATNVSPELLLDDLALALPRPRRRAA